MNKILKTLFGLALFVAFTNDPVWASSGNRRAGVDQNAPQGLAGEIEKALNNYTELVQSGNVGFDKINNELTIHTTSKGQTPKNTYIAARLTRATVGACKAILENCGYDSKATNNLQKDTKFTTYLTYYFNACGREYIKIKIQEDSTVNEAKIDTCRGSALKGERDQITAVKSFKGKKVKIHANAIAGHSLKKLARKAFGGNVPRIEITISIPTGVKGIAIPE